MSDAIPHGTDPGRAMTPEIPGTLRAIGLGAAIGSVVAMVGVGGALFLSVHQASVALGIGGMAAFWGGLGFRSMLGGTMHLIRHGDDPAPSPPLVAAVAEARAAPLNETGAAGERVWSELVGGLEHATATS